jgi:hypothetical protein
VSSPLVEEGSAALRAGDAATARRAFEAALAEVESGEVLEGLAEALYLEREYAASATHYERAYAAYRRERQSMAAGRAARTLAWITGNIFGEWAVQSGWWARARTILEEAGEDRPERGWVPIIRALSEPDAQAREALLRDAVTIGRRGGDPDVEFEALMLLGGLLLMTDRVEEGLVLFDEALAATCAGELRELATVDSILCGFFWACELVNDVPRADQWMRAAAHLMRRRNVAGAFCRAHYGGILTAAGRWSEAETELVQAARRFDRGMPEGRGAALIRLAELRWARWPPSISPVARRPSPAACSSGPRQVRTTRFRRWASRPWPARCSRCSSTSCSSRVTSRTRPGWPGVWTGWPAGNGDPICGPRPRSPRDGSAWPAGGETPSPALRKRWRGSHARSCRWSLPGRVWSWPGPSRT